jgi:predicted enzyme related to lactoylglutathione lyase
MLGAQALVIICARFVHTNIIAQDWKKLARFYEQVLGCTPVPPERRLSGQWLEDGTGVHGAAIEGVHLRLPGYGEQGPTLEIFQYRQQLEPQETAINRPGFAHIAFAVDDVQAAREVVIKAGGGVVGEVVNVTIPGAGEITFVYMTDPEGNIIELQQWSR